MWAKITFFTSVSLAVLLVVLLAKLSPKPPSKDRTTNPRLDLSLYIQQPRAEPARQVAPAEAGAVVFYRVLTEGPESTSRVVGKAQGFIVPAEHFAYSDFNVVYLSFDAPEYSGSLGVRAGPVDDEALTVVGGTGSFAFARGQAVFGHTRGAYHVKLQLRFPNASRTIPG